ncbi:hypothetical protein PGT21_019237 [Puccinia graminis f. sp. tritici]|uniref:Uncharacterized protein n=1 Tax=Puccinia graminis f. sp. tritici TaxID=56615 RepID=A0A5B0MRQ8_PUCGR|nr:hypothetical protein PGT21_019237 [Puccinia graminis f. sp. tritici]KAA1111238.1 hypothetical protein PGTUg99_002157 [Puccinia graminis f. sp. tritici]
MGKFQHLLHTAPPFQSWSRHVLPLLSTYIPPLLRSIPGRDMFSHTTPRIHTTPPFHSWSRYVLPRYSSLALLSAQHTTAVKTDKNKESFDASAKFSRDLDALVEGKEYPQPVNSNSMKPLALRSLVVNGMWATPPSIALKEKQAAARVDKALIKKAVAIEKLKAKKTPKPKTLPGPAPRSRIHVVGRFAGEGSGTAPV